MCNSNKLLAFLIYFSNKKRFIEISMEAIVENRDVNY